MTKPSVMDELPEVECPPPLTTKGILWSRMKERTVVTSEGVVGLKTQDWGWGSQSRLESVGRGRVKRMGDVLIS
jgi:hypothetical protein